MRAGKGRINVRLPLSCPFCRYIRENGFLPKLLCVPCRRSQYCVRVSGEIDMRGVADICRERETIGVMKDQKEGEMI